MVMNNDMNMGMKNVQQVKTAVVELKNILTRQGVMNPEDQMEIIQVVLKGGDQMEDRLNKMMMKMMK